MAYSGWALVALIVSIAILILSIILVTYGVTHGVPPGPPCTEQGQCDSTQQCTGGFCVQTPCIKQSDCGLATTCAYGFCYQNTCTRNSDCTIGSLTGTTGIICMGGLCTPFGQKCSTNTDCSGSGLSCVSGRCSQCATSVDCGGGSAVCGTNGVCFPSCSGLTGVCPSGQMCFNSFCCPAGTYNNTCSATHPCSVGNCVNGACTCGKGVYGNTCLVGADCASGVCVGGFCLNTGNVCFSNFNPGSTNAANCPAGNPFCSNGQCGTDSVGAPCSCFEAGVNSSCTQFNSCNQTLATGPPGTTGSTGRDGSTVSYCVNNRCSLIPGWVGAVCTSPFDCAPISGAPNCTAGRCM